MNFFMLIVLLFAAYPIIVYAQDNSVIIQPPTNAAISSTFRMRVNPVTGVLRPHKGIDYRVPCGTEFQARYGGSLSCRIASGWGGTGEVRHECNVFERYAHLEQCNAGSGRMVSGGGPNSPNRGTSTGCHLHYELVIQGVAVDPQVAFGQELCDPDVQRALIEDAQNKLNGRAGSSPAGGGGGTIGGGGGGGDVDRDPTTGPLPPTVVDDLVPAVEQTDNAPTACDIDVWRGMVNLAVLQTRREMLLNETFIAKPDSVLSYACIAQMWDSMGQGGGALSESQAWRNRQIDILDGETVTIDVDPSSYALDSAIGGVVLGAYDAYFLEYFEHEFLGGTLENVEDDETPGAPEAGHAHGVQSYAQCGNMANVWNLARCRNVDDGTFPTFETLINTDPRHFPHAMACEDSGIAQVMIDRAAQTDIEFSPITLNLAITDGSPPGAEDGEYRCHPPIRTGVTVSRRLGDDQITREVFYLDGLCITAGCTFRRSGWVGGDGWGDSCVVAE